MNLVGGLVGAATGFLTGGPVGAVAGGVSGAMSPTGSTTSNALSSAGNSALQTGQSAYLLANEKLQLQQLGFQYAEQQQADSFDNVTSEKSEIMRESNELRNVAMEQHNGDVDPTELARRNADLIALYAYANRRWPDASRLRRPTA